MRFLLLAFLLPAILFANTSSDGEQAGDKGKVYNDPIGSYNLMTAYGWTILVSHRFEADPKLRQEALDEMANQLFSVTKLVPEAILADMRKTKIWLEYEFPGVGQYHPSDKWLVKNGYNPAKAKGIEIPRAAGFLDFKASRPTNVMMHELCHAYHHGVLGFNEARIAKAYKRAKASKLYDRVLFVNGRTVDHYALTNPMEFFAEMSETYLAVNDYYPFVRGELQKHDPETYKLMAEIWGKW